MVQFNTRRCTRKAEDAEDRAVRTHRATQVVPNAALRTEKTVTHRNAHCPTQNIVAHRSTHWSNFLHHHTFENSLFEPVSFPVKPDQDINASISVLSSVVISFPVVIIH